MYLDLKKIFHTESGAKASSVLQARISDSSAAQVGLRETDPFFYWMAPDVYRRLLDIERLDRQTEHLAAMLPRTAVNHYVSECMIDEIILTNEVEGVVSTRKRFQGIANNYNLLARGERIPLGSCAEIRSLYDDLVLDEVIQEDASKAPDGTYFRHDSVRVVDAADRIIHENNFSEERIFEEMEKQLAFFSNPDIEPLVRAAIFHFAFAYIHPFYDGNGRTNRFMSSYLISQESSRFAGLRLSFSVKEHINDYYKAFTLAEHPLNHGDLTPFVLTFLDIAAGGLQRTRDALAEKQADLDRLTQRILQQYGTDPTLDLSVVGAKLLEGALFTAHGLTAEAIAEEAHLSIPTVHKRLKEFDRAGLIERTRSGHRVLYKLDIDALR